MDLLDKKNIVVANLGRTDYGRCWDLQTRLSGLRTSGRAPDTLLLTEHEHVFTIGKSGDENHLLAGEAELKAKGIAVYHTDRGGDITYHGPGQLVGYPIIDLQNYYCDLHRYLRDLEEVVIRTLEDYGLHGRREEGFTGVWVNDEKICAIGVRSRRWVTMHGFALNVSTDLSYFDRIIPCGVFHRGVTSMHRLLGHQVTLNDLATGVTRAFGSVFGATMTTISQSRLLDMMRLREDVAHQHVIMS
jgi:lipoyl(octanoyl) transferase